MRVLLVDDTIEFLAAARRLLEREGLQVVATATTIAGAARRALETSPDVALVDIDLGGESGFELARRLVEQDPAGPTVILISTHAEVDFADLIAESRAIAFLPKSQLSADAIRRILDHRSR
jgi:two-component system, NarL family, nitrate/nitrite response regulator NarL